MGNFDFDDYLRISDLISHYLRGTLTEGDAKNLKEWMETDQYNLALFRTIINEKQLEIAYNEFKAFDVKTALVKVNSKLKSQTKTAKLYKKWLLPVAASVLLCLSAASYLVFEYAINQQIVLKTKDISPGRTQATLTLYNGQKIILTKKLNGTVFKSGNTAVMVTPGKSIAYSNHAGAGKYIQAGYNTLATEKGEQSPYPLILIDGTKVWLNSASSIIFPTSFAGKDRQVFITGEAYLEVAHSSTHPFIVNVRGQLIHDIGTSFNINAYNDEKFVKTTLITGKIAITKNGQIATLSPGQQAEVTSTGAIKILNNADLEEVLAWKNGLFKFDHADLQTVMRQIARWYNIDVEYEGTIPQDRISGKVYKNLSLSNALEILNSLKIHFRIEKDHGIKKIIITS